MEMIDKKAALKLCSDTRNPYHRIAKEFLLNAPVVNANPELRQVKLKYNGICHYCPDCHTMVDTWDKFCRHCGVKFERSTGNG